MEHTLVVAFDRDSTDFDRGVEIGMLHTELARYREEPRDVPFETSAHVSNIEMVFRLATAHNLSVVSEDGTDERVFLRFEQR